MNQFNNREIASAIWLLAFLGFALSKPDIRSSVAELLRAFFRVKIVVPICLMAIYTTVVVMSLSAISLWNTGLLKDTIIWFCFVGIAIAFNAITSTRAENVFHKILIDSLKITVILEFLVSTYTFSLGVELLVIPMVTVIAMIDAFAGTDPKYAVVAKLTGSLQFLIGVVIVTFAVSGAVHDFGNLKSLDPIRSILLAPLLSVLLSPLVYLMVLESEYEEAFCRLGFSARMDSAVHRYARRRIRMYAGLNLSKLRRISRDHVVDLLDLKTRDDADSLLQAGKDHLLTHPIAMPGSRTLCRPTTWDRWSSWETGEAAAALCFPCLRPSRDLYIPSRGVGGSERWPTCLATSHATDQLAFGRLEDVSLGGASSLDRPFPTGRNPV